MSDSDAMDVRNAVEELRAQAREASENLRVAVMRALDHLTPGAVNEIIRDAKADWTAKR